MSRDSGRPRACTESPPPAETDLQHCPQGSTVPRKLKDRHPAQEARGEGGAVLPQRSSLAPGPQPRKERR